MFFKSMKMLSARFAQVDGPFVNVADAIYRPTNLKLRKSSEMAGNRCGDKSVSRRVESSDPGSSGNISSK